MADGFDLSVDSSGGRAISAGAEDSTGALIRFTATLSGDVWETE